MTVENNNLKQWFVVQVFSGHENYVMREIKQHAENHRDPNIKNLIGEVVVPTEEVVEMRAGKKRKTIQKFFPGYVFVNMVMDNTTWQMIRNIPHVLSFIGGSDKRLPTPISDKEANAMMKRVEEGVSKPRPKILFEPGEVIRVKEGPFVDFNGVVEEVNYDKNRLRVAVLIFGRSTPVELEFGQVEKI